MSLLSGLPVLGMIICAVSFAQPVFTVTPNTAAKSKNTVRPVLKFVVPVNIVDYPANRILVKNAVAPAPKPWPVKRDWCWFNYKRDWCWFDYKRADLSPAARHEAYKKSQSCSTAEFVAEQHLLGQRRSGRRSGNKMEALMRL